jgi:MSHA biogenesis protein MshJ
MKSFWREHLEKLDQLSRRERVIMLVVAIVVVYGIGQFLFLDPKNAAIGTLKNQIQSAQQELEALKTETKILTFALQVGPNQQERLKISQLESDIQRLDERLNKATRELLPPETMVEVLKSLLTQQRDLKLVLMKNMPVKTLVSPKDASVDSGLPSNVGLYKHGFVMKVQGPYMKVHRFLSHIEQQEWKFFWDKLQYQVVEYPTAEVRIEVYTLSTQEGWIGV